MHNHHATVLLLGDRGVLIEGESGAGKTTLALALVSHCEAAGMSACLVADDRVFLSPCHGRLVAATPAPIAGLAEAYGVGPAPVSHAPRSIVDLVVRLVNPEDAPRFCEGMTMQLEGITLPCLELAAKNTQRAVHAIAAFLLLAPFGRKSTRL